MSCRVGSVLHPVGLIVVNTTGALVPAAGGTGWQGAGWCGGAFPPGGTVRICQLQEGTHESLGTPDGDCRRQAPGKSACAPSRPPRAPASWAQLWLAPGLCPLHFCSAVLFTYCQDQRQSASPSGRLWGVLFDF